MNVFFMQCIGLLRTLPVMLEWCFDVVLDAFDRQPSRSRKLGSSWTFIGSHTVLYEAQFDMNGFRFIAQLSVDRQTVDETLGYFDLAGHWDEHAIRYSDGRFFHPAGEHQERWEIDQDMEDAASFGKTWFLYHLSVTVKRGSAMLAKSSLRGIEANPSVFRMDPVIDDLTSSLVVDIEKDALAALARLAKMRVQSTAINVAA